MIDKEKYTSFIKDDETKSFIVKNISKIEGVLKHFDIRNTCFMDPYQQRVFKSILNSFSDDLSYIMVGGNEHCERKMFIIYPNFVFDVPHLIKLLRLYGNFKFEKITHRDCLGALLGLGITRDKTGDIFLHEDFVDIIIDETSENYISSNFTSIKHCSVKPKILDISELKLSKENTTNKQCSVSSLRVDNIISEAFNLSRSVSTNIVKSGRVKIDYEPIFSASKEVCENSLISVKGYGRFRFLSVYGISKKGKIRIMLEIFL